MLKNSICLVTFLVVGILVHAQHDSGLAIFKVQFVNDEDLHQNLYGLEPVLNSLSYNLRFEKNKSFYEAEESLEIGNSKQMEAAKVIGGKGLYYYEKGKGLIIQREFLGDLFLIQPDDNSSIEWEITGERKKVGDFECLKAIGLKKDFNGNKSNVIAWFSTEINAPYGPKDYYGLPGLILEVKDNGVKYFCTSVLFGEQNISKPSKGIQITKKALNEYALKRAREDFKIKYKP